MITKEIQIEDLVENFPFSVKYLSQNGIRCIACGEPIWGTLEEAAKEKNFDDEKIAYFVDELNKMAENLKNTDSKENPGNNISTEKIELS